MSILFFLPIVVYYLAVIPLIWFSKLRYTVSQSKRRAWLIFWLLLPIGDHILGYGVFKILCWSNGGIKIYKTVTDLQEQKDYWFNYKNRHGVVYRGKDELTEYLKKNNLVRKRGRCLNPIKKNDYYICEKNNFKKIYFNYCKEQYDEVDSSKPEYKRSCKYTNKIIEEYQLENVIKVPKKKYAMQVKEYSNKRVIPLLQVYGTYTYSKNLETGELLSESYGYRFTGGMYLKIMEYFLGSGARYLIYCKYKIPDGYFMPNPYKN